MEGIGIQSRERMAMGVRRVIAEMMDRVMEAVLVEDPFIAADHHAEKTLYAALVPDEIFKGSHFERRFVTRFGGVWEELAKVVASEIHGHCSMGHVVTGFIGSERLRRIQEVLDKLEHTHAGRKPIDPAWKEELAYIRQGKGAPHQVSVLCDIYIESESTGEKYAFELKAPLPNSDQSKVSKEKMFKLLAMDPCVVDHVFFALPYNPFGKREDYDWSFPSRWFNMQQDPVVLIGNEFWDFIGGAGTYASFVREINALGLDYKKRIYREYLGMEPPSGYNEQVLK
ncbi:hypothetical protein PDESU_04746 [Pontiella desulfatans]|uniref:type II site-specific deoxyribonuclease n=2 Tax=Pontiella desulfatans TaxID=2750659 RepID=A0A6C2U9V0_PONDE|nr:hypothetical protein PDESU_04746 [Pontiella desulfatans]